MPKLGLVRIEASGDNDSILPMAVTQVGIRHSLTSHSSSDYFRFISIIADLEDGALIMFFETKVADFLDERPPPARPWNKNMLFLTTKFLCQRCHLSPTRTPQNRGINSLVFFHVRLGVSPRAVCSASNWARVSSTIYYTVLSRPKHEDLRTRIGG